MNVRYYKKDYEERRTSARRDDGN